MDRGTREITGTASTNANPKKAPLTRQPIQSSENAKRQQHQANLTAKTLPRLSWPEFPPTAKPEAQKVRYIGQGIGAAAGVNLCVVAQDLRIRTRNVVDGRCPHDGGLMPHRLFVTARAWARCAVLCNTP
jgi:hypothetical protein